MDARDDVEDNARTIARTILQEHAQVEGKRSITQVIAIVVAACAGLYAGFAIASLPSYQRDSNTTIRLTSSKENIWQPTSHAVVEATKLARPFQYGFFTYVASNDIKYIRWALLQHYAASKFMPKANHGVIVASSVNNTVKEALAAHGANVTEVHPFREAHQHGTTWINQLTKLKLWTKIDYDLVCHLDSDVIFFSNITKFLVDECRQMLFDPNQNVEICGYESEACQEGQFNMGNRDKWGMPYMQASIFCLRPDLTTYRSLVNYGVKLLQRQQSVTMHGKDVFTEQDFLNLFFKDRIHYYECFPDIAPGIGNGTIYHDKQVEEEWVKRMGPLPAELDELTARINGSL